MEKQKTLQYKGISLYYRLYGSGKPVILLHGFGEDGQIFENQIASLKDKAQLIVPDLPGSGLSPILKNASSMDDYAASIKAIMEEENMSSCIMIGHSMGGYITLAFVEKYPEFVDSFGLFHSSAYADDESKKETRQKGIEFIKQHGASKFVEQTTQNLFSPITKESYPELIRQITERYANFNPDSLVQYYEAMMKRPDRTAVLKNAGKPVMFIFGQHDTAIPLEKGLEQSHLPEFSYIHICKNSGHMGMLEETEFCNEALEKFIKEA